MIEKMSRSIFLMIILISAWSSSVFAQQPVIDGPLYFIYFIGQFNFFYAILTVIAIAICLVLSAIGVARGINIVKPEKKIRQGHEKQSREHLQNKNSLTVMKINNASGFLASGGFI